MLSRTVLVHVLGWACALLRPGVGPHLLVPGKRGHSHATLDGGHVRGEGGVRYGRDSENAGTAYCRPGRRAQTGKFDAFTFGPVLCSPFCAGGVLRGLILFDPIRGE